MDALVVAQDPVRRWAAAAALGLSAAAACPPDVAAWRLAHPSSPRPDAVLLLVHDEADVAWLRRQLARPQPVPVAVAAPARLVAAARAAGASEVVADDAASTTLAGALAAAAAPAPVIDLDTVRSA